jgi:hypothetical protein
MEDEVKELEEMSGSTQESEEETPEQVLDQVKAYLLQKFKEAGVEKYEVRQATTGIIIKYDGQKVEITHPKTDVVKLLSTNSLANFFFGEFLKSLSNELDLMKYRRKKK